MDKIQDYLDEGIVYWQENFRDTAIANTKTWLNKYRNQNNMATATAIFEFLHENFPFLK